MNWARLYFGALIVALGTILLLDAADVLDAGEVLGNWWPVAIIGAGLLALITNPRHWPIPVIIVVGGTALLLATTGVVDSLAIVIPGLVILVGLFVIFGFGASKTAETGNRVRTFNVFSGSEIASHSTTFEGGNVGTFFGGTEIDLRDATPTADAALDVFVAFGGVEIKVPEGWQVDVHGLPMFGGFENATAREQLGPDAPSLDVRATALFGGVEVGH